jgi:hypothetical protein
LLAVNVLVFAVQEMETICGGKRLHYYALDFGEAAEMRLDFWTVAEFSNGSREIRGEFHGYAS